MRLVDADALKEDLTKWFPQFTLEGIEAKTLFNQILHDIDNAPTVEPCYQTTSCLDCGNYDKENHNCPRYCEVIKEAIKSRSQGAWIDYDNTFYKCPECGYLLEKCCPQCQTKVILPICHCDADMRGKEE